MKICNDETKDITADYFYHGCNDNGLRIYHEQGYLAINYFGEDGLWITPIIEHAKNHGNHVFKIDGLYLDARNLDVDHDDDGIFHKGGIPFHNTEKL